jgi:hypothetical protein
VRIQSPLPMLCRRVHMVKLRIPERGAQCPNSEVELLRWLCVGLTEEQALRVRKHMCGYQLDDVGALKGALTTEEIEWELA